MQVNSINNFGFCPKNHEVQTVNFGALKFKDKALENATRGMKNLLDVKVESDNLHSAEKAIRKWFKMFTEPWDLRVARHEHLPKFVQQFEDTFIKRIYRNVMPAYNERLASLGKEAEDLGVEVTNRVVNCNNEVLYTVDIPAMKVKDKVFKLKPKETTKEFSMCGVPTEAEINLLKKGVYEEVVGKDIATFNNPGYDIQGKFKKLLDVMT